MYATGLPDDHRRRAVVYDGRLPFVVEASGSETHLTNGLDPELRARRFFGFPGLATLARWLRDADADPNRPTWRAKVQHLPPVPTEAEAEGMRPAQVRALVGIERSLAEGRHDRSLVQMATGAGKTGRPNQVQPGLQRLPVEATVAARRESRLASSTRGSSGACC
jgi:type I restriction enzyme R subunit